MDVPGSRRTTEGSSFRTKSAPSPLAFAARLPTLERWRRPSCRRCLCSHPVPTARFRFHAELNHFLAPDCRGRDIHRPFPEGATVKHMIEALGVPHTEVDLLLVNGEAADFAYRL